MSFLYPLAICLLLVSSCAHSYRDRIDRELGLWLKQTPDRLVETWGAPRSTYIMDSGRKILSYENATFISRTMGPLYYYPRPEVYSYSDSCKISFYTDTSQKVLESYSFTGSAAVCWDMIEAGRSTTRVGPTPSQEVPRDMPAP